MRGYEQVSFVLQHAGMATHRHRNRPFSFEDLFATIAFTNTGKGQIGSGRRNSNPGQMRDLTTTSGASGSSFPERCGPPLLRMGLFLSW